MASERTRADRCPLSVVRPAAVSLSASASGAVRTELCDITQMSLYHHTDVVGIDDQRVVRARVADAKPERFPTWTVMRNLQSWEVTGIVVSTGIPPKHTLRGYRTSVLKG